MLQIEYYYVGYLLWGTLFGGVYLGLVTSVMEMGLKVERKKEQKLSLMLLSTFVLLCSIYVVVYYMRNGVFL